MNSTRLIPIDEFVVIEQNKDLLVLSGKPAVKENLVVMAKITGALLVMATFAFVVTSQPNQTLTLGTLLNLLFVCIILPIWLVVIYSISRPYRHVTFDAENNLITVETRRNLSKRSTQNTYKLSHVNAIGTRIHRRRSGRFENSPRADLTIRLGRSRIDLQTVGQHNETIEYAEWLRKTVRRLTGQPLDSDNLDYFFKDVSAPPGEAFSHASTGPIVK